jgi:hypothetical protein
LKNLREKFGHLVEGRVIQDESVSEFVSRLLASVGSGTEEVRSLSESIQIHEARSFYGNLTPILQQKVRRKRGEIPTKKRKAAAISGESAMLDGWNSAIGVEYTVSEDEVDRVSSAGVVLQTPFALPAPLGVNAIDEGLNKNILVNVFSPTMSLEEAAEFDRLFPAEASATFSSSSVDTSLLPEVADVPETTTEASYVFHSPPYSPAWAHGDPGIDTAAEVATPLGFFSARFGFADSGEYHLPANIDGDDRRRDSVQSITGSASAFGQAADNSFAIDSPNSSLLPAPSHFTPPLDEYDDRYLWYDDSAGSSDADNQVPQHQPQSKNIWGEPDLLNVTASAITVTKNSANSAAQQPFIWSERYPAPKGAQLSALDESNSTISATLSTSTHRVIAIPKPMKMVFLTDPWGWFTWWVPATLAAVAPNGTPNSVSTSSAGRRRRRHKHVRRSRGSKKHQGLRKLYFAVCGVARLPLSSKCANIY